MLFYILFSLFLNQLNYYDNHAGNIDIKVTGVRFAKNPRGNFIRLALFHVKTPRADHRANIYRSTVHPSAT